MGNLPDWRSTAVMDLMVYLMKDWETEDMKKVILELPRIPISQGITVSDSEKKVSLTETSEVVPATSSEEQIDFNHPSSYFGYVKRLEAEEELERSRERLTTDIIAYDTNTLILTLPYKAQSNEWFPDEIGVLIGRLLTDEWELDHITYLLVDLATKHFADDPKQHSWENYLGYMGIILSSACAIQRHWENEDIMWVYKDFCIDVGKWAMYTWPEFGEMEYREWLADIIPLVALRRNDADHDTKLISLILDETCETWNIEKGEILGYMIEARMKPKSFPYVQIDRFLNKLGVKKSLPHPTFCRSLLWSPPPHYYLPNLWLSENEKREFLHIPPSK